jgi:aryl-alcohol dehydrogenase-like predicted oxidoreductase
MLINKYAFMTSLAIHMQYCGQRSQLISTHTEINEHRLCTMRRRSLGSQGLVVSTIGFGAMGLTSFYGSPVTDEEGIDILNRSVELGVNFFDTAEAYCYTDKDGERKKNESLIGKAIRKIGRDKVVIATKHKPGGIRGLPCTNQTELRNVIRTACNDSLKTLGIDCIDLYYLHRIYPAPHTIEQVMECFKELVDEGKIKYVGLSEAPPEYIRRAHAITPISAIQQEWSIIARDLEGKGGVVDTCRELGIGIVPYSPIARGFLAGAYQNSDPKDCRANIPYLSPHNKTNNVTVVKQIEQLASDRKLSLPQLSLAWVINQGNDVVPIPGTTNVAHLEDNVKAACVKLSSNDITKLGKLGDLIRGNRMNEKDMQMSFKMAKWD